MLCRCLPLVAVVLIASVPVLGAEFETGVVVRSDGAEFYVNAIPQIARLANNQLLAVWDVHSKPSGKPMSVYSAFSSDEGRTWSAPRKLLSDPEKGLGDPNILVDGPRVMVFATKVPHPNLIKESWTVVTRSEDNGATWSEPAEIPIPHKYVVGKQATGLVLRDGTYLLGVAWDKWPEIGLTARSEGEMDLTAGVLRSTDRGKTWTLHGALHAVAQDKATPGGTNGLCEPSLVELASGELLMIMRSGSSNHYESRSTDGGLTWSSPLPSPLPGHNTPSTLIRLREHPQEIVAVWNNDPRNRFPLVIALSADGGKSWSKPKILASGDGKQVSYPGITQTPEGTLVAVWQQVLPEKGRDIRWARFTRDWILKPE